MANLKMNFKALMSRLVSWLKRIPSEDFARDFTVRALVIIPLILLIVIWIFAVLSFPPADYLVPLRYNSFLGVTALGAWYQLYVVPLILLLVFVLNIILAHTTYAKDKMVSYILLGSTIFVIVCGAAVVVNLSQVLTR